MYLLPADENLHPCTIGVSDDDIVEYVLDHFGKSQFGFRYLDFKIFIKNA